MWVARQKKIEQHILDRRMSEFWQLKTTWMQSEGKTEEEKNQGTNERTSIDHRF